MKLQQLQPPAPPATLSPRILDSPRRVVAIHEASHAVVAFALGAELGEQMVTVRGDNGVSRFRWETPPCIGVGAAATAAGTMGQVLFLSIGETAPAPIEPEPPELAALPGDQELIDKAFESLRRQAGPQVVEDDRRLFSKLADERAMEILRQCESAVEGLAALLMRRGRLDGEQATNVLLGHGMTQGCHLTDDERNGSANGMTRGGFLER